MSKRLWAQVSALLCVGAGAEALRHLAVDGHLLGEPEALRALPDEEVNLAPS